MRSLTFSSSQSTLGSVLDLSQDVSGTVSIHGSAMEIDLAADSLIAIRDRINGLGITGVSASVETVDTDGGTGYRLAEPGEVLPAGGKVLTLLDLTDVYMTIFLPTSQVGRVNLGAEARIIFDAAPEYVVPASVSFVAPRAQFTPKEVETHSEREKLMFRVKVRIAPELLQQHIEKVKTGVPGVAYVRLDPAAEWPQQLRVKLPQ